MSTKSNQKKPKSADLPLGDSLMEKPMESDIDATTMYLREIGFSPLLSAKDEVDLAHKLKKGDVAARNRMIESNLRCYQ